MSTKVRLTDAEVFPAHGIQDHLGESLLLTPEVWARYRNTIVTVGKPEKPQSHWNCGTDVVFVMPVLAVEELQTSEKEQGLEPYGYLCRHQIQAGD